MQLKLDLDEKTLFDHRQFHNLSAEPVFLKKVHIFQRREPNQNCPNDHANVHSQFILWVCLDGRGSLLVDNVAYLLKEDEAMITFPGQPHMRLPLDGQTVNWLLIRFETDPPEWLSLLRSRLLRLPENSRQYLQEFVLCHQNARRDPRPMLVTECAFRLGLLLNSLREAVVDRLEDVQTVIESRGHQYVKEVCQLMMSPEFSGKPFCLIARKLGISPGHLRTVFRNTIGQTPAQVVKNTRYSTAQHLLTHSTLNITQIAEKLGFESVYSFSRFFHQQSGVSPREFRDRNTTR